MPPKSPYSAIIHPYKSPTRNSCAYEIGPKSAHNAILFIGGLGDGPHTVPHVRHLGEKLETLSDLGYSVFEIRMRSSFIGFGTSSLKNDVEDISALVTYLRGIGKEKIVLFGHSTGCQDCIEYADYTKHGNEPVDGFIMQGPVSDRDALEMVMPDPQPSFDYATQMIAEGRTLDCMPSHLVPKELGAPVSAYRFLSLASKGGDDNYFSADLDDATVTRFWGRFKQPVLALHSEKDEFVPPHVDQAALNKRYREANPIVSLLSGLISGAGHTVKEPEAQEWLADRVIQFLRTLEKQ